LTNQTPYKDEADYRQPEIPGRNPDAADERRRCGRPFLLAHGISTVYCLPGVQSDHLFNAMFDAGDALRVVHTRHEQGAAYMRWGRLGDRPARGLFGGGPARDS